MKELTTYEFITAFCKDVNIEPIKDVHFKLPAKKEYIKNFVSGNAFKVRIFDGENEYPYMSSVTPPIRNDEKLNIGKELRMKIYKSFTDIQKESCVEIHQIRVRISEGAGWYSWGIRYTYKDFFCEC